MRHPVCKCGTPYPEPREFKWGSKLFRTLAKVQVYVCDDCMSYWFSSSTPQDLKKYAFKIFDQYNLENRLPTPDIIRQYKINQPEAYHDIDVEAYERGEVSNLHPLYYQYYAEHISSEINERHTKIEKTNRAIKTIEDDIISQKSKLATNKARLAKYKSELSKLEKYFLK